MSWTEDRVEVLKKLWAEGHSASQIAKELGGVTRNAVIGKVHRLGLSGRATPSRPVKRPPRLARPKPRVQPDGSVVTPKPSRLTEATLKSSEKAAMLAALEIDMWSLLCRACQSRVSASKKARKEEGRI